MKKSKIISAFLSLVTATAFLPAMPSFSEQLFLDGDVNTDCMFNTADISAFSGYLTKKNTIEGVGYAYCDMNGDEKYDVFDYILLRRKYINQNDSTLRTVTVENSVQLQSALDDAKAGDKIVLKSGTYITSETGSKGANFWSFADGTKEHPITITSEDSKKPAVIHGINIENGVGLYITGDNWNIENLTVENAQKGIILDNSNYSVIKNCTVTQTGSEGIHLRDNSTYCTVDSCTVTNTGRVSPGYGEAVYVGSSESTSGYGYNCDFNTIENCILGPGVTAELVDIKEYTTGTVVRNCTMYGDDISGATSANAFLKAKGNECIIENNIAYQNGNTIIRNAFEVHELVTGWGYNNTFKGNTCNMDNDNAYVVRVYSGSATASDNARIPEGLMYYGTD